MIDPLRVLQELNDWRREWRQERDKRINPTLRLALESCHALVDIEDVRSDEGVLLHERVKSLYRDASNLLSVRLQPEDVEIVIHALASARMYYWIRYLNGCFGDELEMLIRRRSGTFGQLPSSLSAVYLAVKAVTPEADPEDVPGLPRRSLDLLRSGCLSDFSRLEVVVLRYGASDA